MRNLFVLSLLCGLTTNLTAQSTLLTDYWFQKHPDLWLEYNDIRPVSATEAVVQRDDLWGLMDFSGKLLTPAEYRSMNPDYEDPELISVYTPQGQSGYINARGETILPAVYGSVQKSAAYLLGCTNNQCTAFNIEGKKQDVPAVGKYYVRHKYGEYWEASADNTFWGLAIDAGEWIVAPEYSHFSSLQDGYFNAVLGNQMKLIHPEKKWSSTQFYASIGFVTARGFWAKKLETDSTMQFYDFKENALPNMIRPEKITHQKHWGFAIYNQAEQSGILDENGNTVLAGCDKINTVYFSRNATLENPKPFYGFIPLLEVTKEGKTGLFDGKKWIIHPKYYRISGNQDYLVASDSTVTDIYNLQGKLLHTLPLPLAYLNAENWIASATRIDAAGLLPDKTITLPPGTSYLNPLPGQFISLRKTNGLHALLDSSMAVLLDNLDNYRNEAIRVFGGQPYIFTYQQNGYYGWYLPNEKRSIPAIYEKIICLRNGTMAVQQKLHWGLVHADQTAILPVEYEDINFSYYGRIALKKDGYWSVFTPKGKRLITPELLEVTWVGAGAFWGRTAKGWQLYNKSGKAILPNTLPQPELRNFYNSGFVVKDPSSHKYGCISGDGSITVPFEWDSIINESIFRKGDSLHFRNNNRTLFTSSGTTATSQYPIGYAVLENGKYRFIKNNGAPFNNKNYISYQQAQMIPGILFLAKAAARKWELIDYKGNTTRALTADSVWNYLPGYLAWSDGDKKWLLHVASGKTQAQQWEHASQLDGRSTVLLTMNNKKYGLADANLNELLPCIYTRISRWRGNYLQVVQDNKTGLFDQSGKECIPVDQYATSNFEWIGTDMVAVTKNGLKGYYSISTKTWIPPSLEDMNSCQVRVPLQKNLYWFRVNGKYGVMDEDCKQVLAPTYKKIVSTGDFLLLTDISGTALCNPVNMKIISTGWQETRPYLSHIACRNDTIWSIFNTEKQIYSGVHQYMEWVAADLLVFTNTDRSTGAIRPDGTIVIPAEYRSLMYLGKQYEAFEAYKGNKLGLIDLQNKVILPFEFDRKDTEIYGGNHLILQKNKLWGIYSFDGTQILDTAYEKIVRSSGDNLHYMAKKEGKWSYFDRNGITFGGGAYEDVHEFVHGMAAVQQGGKWGYINLSGTIAIPFQYRYAGNFDSWQSRSIALVIDGEQRYRSINTDGSIFAEGAIAEYGSIRTDLRVEQMPAYKEIPFYGGEYTINGFYFVSRQDNEKAGLVNLLGEWTLRPEYDEMKQVTINPGKTKSIAMVRQGKLWGLVDCNGKIMVAPKYERMEQITEYPIIGRFKVSLGGKTMELKETEL